MKAMPVFSPEPMKLKPETWNIPATLAVSFSSVVRICAITRCVRCSEAPGGNDTMASAKPWSSLGTKPRLAD